MIKGMKRTEPKKPANLSSEAEIAELKKAIAEKDVQLAEQAQTLTDIQLGMAELYETILTGGVI